MLKNVMIHRSPS